MFRIVFENGHDNPKTAARSASTAIRAVQSAQGLVLIFAVAVLLSLAGSAAAFGKEPPASLLNLESFITEQKLWNLSSDAICERSQSKFRQGMCKTELMYANRGDDAFKFLGLPIEECVIRLDGNKLKNLYLLLRYAKDAHEAGKIKAAHSAAKDALSILCGEPGKPHEFSWTKDQKISIWRWKTPAARIYLYTNEGLPHGYVSVLIERGDLPERNMEERLRVSAKDLPEKIVDGSSVWLAVPMRHQLREIGACWSATLARQLAYLGSEIEPQMAAQMTVPHEEAQLRSLGPRLGFYAKVYEFFNEQDACRNSVNLLMRYNQAASAHNAPPIKYKETETSIVFAEGFTLMDNSLLKTIPLDKQDHEKYAQFRKIVTTFIDQSVPLSWTVTRWSSKNGKDSGRHRRMIVGYDAKRDLLYFSDPWGFNTEKESMPMRAAFSMTIWLQAICPKSLPKADLP
jgi:hypothetical protein